MRKLYIRQKVFKITDHYPVLDENGEALYQVDQDFTFIGMRIHVTRHGGTPVFTIERKLLTFLPQFVITYADGKEVLLKSRLSLLRKVIDIFPEELNLSIRGSYMDHDFSILRRGEVIAEIHKKWLTWGDCFEITIHDEALQDLSIGVMIALDAMLDAEAAAAASH